METYTEVERKFIEKIRHLTPEQIIEVENFIDFLSQQKEDRYLTLGATKLSEPIFSQIWNNSEDAEYDNL